MNVNTVLQDANVFRRILVETIGANSQIFFVPDKDQYVRDAYPPSHNLQDQSGYSPPFGVPYLSLVYDPPIPVTLETNLASVLFGKSYTYIAGDLDPGDQDIWVHFQEPDLWGRVIWAQPFSDGRVLDFPLMKADGTVVPIRNGWHIDRKRLYNWSVSELSFFARLENRDPQFLDDPFYHEHTFPRILTPRIIDNVNSRYWLATPMEYFGGSVPLRKALPGMKAVKMFHSPNQSNGIFIEFLGRWYQDLNVYQFNGKKWLPLPVYHHNIHFPDVLDSNNPDPNFHYYSDRAYSQFYWGYWSYNDLTGETGSG